MFQTWSAVIVESKENREKIFFGSLRNRSIMGLAVDVVKDGKLIINIVIFTHAIRFYSTFGTKFLRHF